MPLQAGWYSVIPPLLLTTLCLTYPPALVLLCRPPRGYGRSSGKPSPKACRADATAIMRYIIQELNATRVIVVAESIGVRARQQLHDKTAR